MNYLHVQIFAISLILLCLNTAFNVKAYNERKLLYSGNRSLDHMPPNDPLKIQLNFWNDVEYFTGKFSLPLFLLTLVSFAWVL